MKAHTRWFLGASGLLICAAMGCGGDDGGVNGTSCEEVRPTIAGALINDGSPVTTSRVVSVAITASDNVGVTEVAVSEDPSSPSPAWQPYQAALAVDLSPGDGTKTIHIQARDACENVSSSRSDAIVLAEITPIAYLHRFSTAATAGSFGGDTFVLELAVANMVGMYTAEFHLTFDPQRLQVTELQVDIPGHILKSSGANLNVLFADFDNDAGEIGIGCGAFQDGFQGVSGSGPFARITFEVDASSSATTMVDFAGDPSSIFQYQTDGPPEPMQGVIFADGEVTP